MAPEYPKNRPSSDRGGLAPQIVHGLAAPQKLKLLSNKWMLFCDDVRETIIPTSKGVSKLREWTNEAFEQVIKECNEHNLHLQSLIRKIEENNLDIQTTRNEDHFGAAIHHLSLIRNKRCLMAYMYNRAEIIQSLRWKVGPVLPKEIQEKLNYSEEEYFKNHSAALESYMSEMDLDLTVDMVPPKDPYIWVRVLDDIGEVCLGDHSIALTKNSLHFLRRSDAEPFVSQGLMEEFVE